MKLKNAITIGVLTGLILLSGSGTPQLFAAEGDTKPVETSLFPDKNLEAAVRHYVFDKRNTDKPIVEKDVANISTIKARGASITNLAGLEKCRSLASLDLANNQVRDLTPIAGLPRLQFLDVANNNIRDITPLKNNVALQYIELSQNRVKNINIIAGLTNLASLYLGRNRIQDIGPVTDLPKLASLYLENNRIRSVYGLAKLKSLWTLSLSDNRIDDITPLKGLKGLYHLFLENNKITDISTLVEMGQNDKEKRFIPFINIYLKGNPLTPAASGDQWKTLKELGARMHK